MSSQNDSETSILGYLDPDGNMFGRKSHPRLRTAPTRLFDATEDFAHSPALRHVERAVFYLNLFCPSVSLGLELDSPAGQSGCLNFLKALENLLEALGARAADRGYLSGFSKAYRVLYAPERVCYLSEILDSAYESSPYLFVNGERYEFSAESLERGVELFRAFAGLQATLRTAFAGACEAEMSLEKLRAELEAFDGCWVAYESVYVTELMRIELDARRLIREAIAAEHTLAATEATQLENVLDLRRRLCEAVARLNAVANFEGHGRDDLDHAVLLAAEEVLLRVSPSESAAVRRLAEGIRAAFAALRGLFRRYGDNLEAVDPQLRNNEELVDALWTYERCWEKGKIYFLDKHRCEQLIFLSHVVEGLCEKYAEFAEKADCCDAEIFIHVPMVLLLKCADGEDRGICDTFLGPVLRTGQSFPRLQELLRAMRERFLRIKEIGKRPLAPKAVKSTGELAAAAGRAFPAEFYLLMERCALLGSEADCPLPSAQLNEALRLLRMLAMELQRTQPLEWNCFFELAIDFKAF